MTLWPLTPLTTIGPTVVGGPSPRELIAVTRHEYVLPMLSLLTMIGLVTWVGLLGAPPSIEVQRAR